MRFEAGLTVFVLYAAHCSCRIIGYSSGDGAGREETWNGDGKRGERVNYDSHPPKVDGDITAGDPSAVAGQFKPGPVAKQRRCSPSGLVGLANFLNPEVLLRSNVPLAVSRRDLQAQVTKKLCANCLARPTCKVHKKCDVCEKWCTAAEMAPLKVPNTNEVAKSIGLKTDKAVVGSARQQPAPETATPGDATLGDSPKLTPEESAQEETRDDPKVAIANRFGESDDTNSMKRIYTVAALKSGLTKEVICKMLGIQDTSDIDTVVVWVSTKSNKPPKFAPKYQKTVTPEAERLTRWLNDELNRALKAKKDRHQGDYLTNSEIMDVINSMSKDTKKHHIQTGRPRSSSSEEFLPPYTVESNNLAGSIPRVVNPGVIEDAPDIRLLGAEEENNVETRIGQTDGISTDKHEGGSGVEKSGIVDSSHAATEKGDKEGETLTRTEESVVVSPFTSDSDEDEDTGKPEKGLNTQGDSVNDEEPNAAEVQNAPDAQPVETLGTSKLVIKKQTQKNKGARERARVTRRTGAACWEYPEQRRTMIVFHRRRVLPSSREGKEASTVSVAGAGDESRPPSGDQIVGGGPEGSRTDPVEGEAMDDVQTSGDASQGQEMSSKSPTEKLLEKIKQKIASKKPAVPTVPKKSKVKEEIIGAPSVPMTGKPEEGTASSNVAEADRGSDGLRSVDAAGHSDQGLGTPQLSDQLVPKPVAVDDFDAAEAALRDVEKLVSQIQKATKIGHDKGLLAEQQENLGQRSPNIAAKAGGVKQQISGPGDSAGAGTVDSGAPEGTGAGDRGGATAADGEAGGSVGEPLETLGQRSPNIAAKGGGVKQQISGPGDSAGAGTVDSGAPEGTGAGDGGAVTTADGEAGGSVGEPLETLGQRSPNIAAKGGGVKQQISGPGDSAGAGTVDSGAPEGTGAGDVGGATTADGEAGGSVGEPLETLEQRSPNIAAKGGGVQQQIGGPGDSAGAGTVDSGAPEGTGAGDGGAATTADGEAGGSVGEPLETLGQRSPNIAAKGGGVKQQISGPGDSAGAGTVDSGAPEGTGAGDGGAATTADGEAGGSVGEPLETLGQRSPNIAAKGSGVKQQISGPGDFSTAGTVDSGVAEEAGAGNEGATGGAGGTATTADGEGGENVGQSLDTLGQRSPNIAAKGSGVKQQISGPGDFTTAGAVDSGVAGEGGAGDGGAATTADGETGESVGQPQEEISEVVGSQPLEEIDIGEDIGRPVIKIPGFQGYRERTNLGNLPKATKGKSGKFDTPAQGNSMGTGNGDASEGERLGVASQPPSATTDVDLKTRFSEDTAHGFGHHTWSNSLGQIVPSEKETGIVPIPPKNMFFIGNGIKLPLQMVQKDDGAVHLAVDMDKLCACQNTTCPKNHTIEETVGTILEKEAELKDQLSETGTESSNDDGSAGHRIEREIVDDQLAKIRVPVDGPLENDDFDKRFRQLESEIKSSQGTAFGGHSTNGVVKKNHSGETVEAAKEDGAKNDLPKLDSTENSNISPYSFKKMMDRKIAEIKAKISNMEKKSEVWTKQLFFPQKGLTTLLSNIEKEFAKPTTASNPQDDVELIEPRGNLFRIDSVGSGNSRMKSGETYDDVIPIKSVYKFQKLEEDLEDKLEKFDEFVGQYSKDNERAIDESAKSFQKHEGNALKKEVGIMNNVIKWLKHMTVDNYKK
ncbi:hypothetical protein NQ318_019564 [Aromia moschata]|uniref:Uncharacterized protein n=1 Tax=Aromia moschata TaxID=1265417 RepID=A0AAV8Z5Z8_9CUCU|nr:hypothetical protein NQ318_019564 [Aromia moschata]